MTNKQETRLRELAPRDELELTWAEVVRRLRYEQLDGKSVISECSIDIMFYHHNYPTSKRVSLRFPNGKHYSDAVKELAKGLGEVNAK